MSDQRPPPRDWFFREHENFLTDRVADAASSYCDHLINSDKHVWSTNYGWLKGKETGTHSNPRLERYENLVLVHRIVESNPKLYENILLDIQKHYPNLEPETPEACQFFVWTGGSRIEWHMDFKAHLEKNRRAGAITIYLNRKWDLEWGGDFLYKNQQGKVERVTPDYNKAVHIGAVDHRSTIINGRHFRKCIQIFVKERQQPVDITTDFC
jgi:hypothetical protein